ncbi:MAG: hypothetical protein U1D55_07005 [Phycisphaerae bacterium]
MTDAFSTVLLEQHVLAPLAALRRRARLYAMLRGVLRLAVALALAGASQLLIDRWLRLSLDQRAALNVAITIYWFWVLYRWILMPLQRPLSEQTLAGLVDEAHPELFGRLSTAVELIQGPLPESASPQLISDVIREACDAAPKVKFLAVLDHPLARRRAVELGILGAGVALICALAPDTIGTWFQRNWLVRDLPWPQSTYIHPDGFDAGDARRVPRGDEFELTALVEGQAPRSAVVQWWTPAGQRGRETMRRVGERRLFAPLGVMGESLSFRIVGGDETTRVFTLVPVDRPQVVHVEAQIAPPGYTRAAPATLEQQTSLEMLAGSRLTLDVSLNKPVATARFVGIGGEAAPCELIAPDKVRVDWDAPTSGSFRFELVDRDGWESRRPVVFSLKVLPDRAPLLKLDAQNTSEIITPIAELPLSLHARDDYGLGSVSINVARGDEPAQPIPLPDFEAGRPEYQAQVRLAVREMGAAIGDRLRIVAQATDEDPRGPNIGRGDPLELRVVSTEDFLAELARRELELRREFERLISVQRGADEALRQMLDETDAARLASAAIGQRVAGLVRRQEVQAAACAGVSRRFLAILAEMRVNRVARVGDERRIEDRIVEPLDRLTRESMPAASVALLALRGDASDGARNTARDMQGDILRRMQAILANMMEWEGYREAVALLQETIDAQKQVHEATIEALQKQLDDILGSKEPSSPDRPKP